MTSNGQVQIYIRCSFTKYKYITFANTRFITRKWVNLMTPSISLAALKDGMCGLKCSSTVLLPVVSGFSKSWYVCLNLYVKVQHRYLYSNFIMAMNGCRLTQLRDRMAMQQCRHKISYMRLYNLNFDILTNATLM